MTARGSERRPWAIGDEGEETGMMVEGAFWLLLRGVSPSGPEAGFYI